MTQTETRGELVLVESPQPVRYIHTRHPASIVANSAVGLASLVGAGTLVAAFTGHLDIESPLVLPLMLLLYLLGAIAWVARERADHTDVVYPEELP